MHIPVFSLACRQVTLDWFFSSAISNNELSLNYGQFEQENLLNSYVIRRRCSVYLNKSKNQNMVVARAIGSAYHFPSAFERIVRPRANVCLRHIHFHVQKEKKRGKPPREISHFSRR